MNKEIYANNKNTSPLSGLETFFVNTFTNERYEYGTNHFGICRYPLDSFGKRIIVEQTSQNPSYSFVIEHFEIVAPVTIYPNDTPTSIYFTLHSETDDIYSEHLGSLYCPFVEAFLFRIEQHLDLMNIKNTANRFNTFVINDFKVFFNYKYEHSSKTISRVASIMFNSNNEFEKNTNFYIVGNEFTVQETMRKIDIEFFNRYYKEKIKEAIPTLNFEESSELIDISTWSNRLKSLVKMTNY